MTVEVDVPFLLQAGKGIMLDAIQREEKDMQRRQRAREHLMKLNQRKREERVSKERCQITGGPSLGIATMPYCR